jgi:hypothetical protein
VKPHVVFGLIAVSLSAITPFLILAQAPSWAEIPVIVSAGYAALKAGDLYLQEQGN